MARSWRVGSKPLAESNRDPGYRALTIRGLALLAGLLLAACASSPPRASDHVARVELLALLQTLNADLLSHDSATLTLERWCADHHLAVPARIVAQRVRDADQPIPAELQARLASAAGATRYRHVRLMCGERVLSEADNWYLPGALTAQMNEQLDSTDEPFGKVVKALGFQRRTVSAELLWSPLSPGWEMGDDSATTSLPALQIPPALLRHEAILYSAAGVPFSALVETYTNQLFAFDGWAGYTH